MTTKTAEGKPAESVQSREQQQGHRFLRYSTECSDRASLNLSGRHVAVGSRLRCCWIPLYASTGSKTSTTTAPVDENEPGGMALAQARGYTHRSWRAERRPFLTVLHSSQPPVLGRSDQFRIMCRLLFRRSAVRRGGKVLLSKCKATSCNHHNFAIGSAPYKSGVGVSISGQPKTICRATNCRGCTTCPRAIQTCAHQSSDSRSTVKSILNGPGVTA